MDDRRWSLFGTTPLAAGPPIPDDEEPLTVMPVEDHEAELVETEHHRKFWAWKFERREAECEELADRLRAAEARAEAAEKERDELVAAVEKHRDAASPTSTPQKFSRDSELYAVLDPRRQRTESLTSSEPGNETKSTSGADSSGPGAGGER